MKTFLIAATCALLATALATPAHAQHRFWITDRWVSGGNAGGPEGTGGITVDEGEEVEFTINAELPPGAPGSLWVAISCGGGTNCYAFADTHPRIGAEDAPSNPNTYHMIPTSTVSDSWGWTDENGQRTIALPFLVTTKDDNCKKRGSPRYIEVKIQANHNGGGSQSGSVRITIADDDQDATDPLYQLTFLKPECESTFGD